MHCPAVRVTPLKICRNEVCCTPCPNATRVCHQCGFRFSTAVRMSYSQAIKTMLENVALIPNIEHRADVTAAWVVVFTRAYGRAPAAADFELVGLSQ